MREFDDTVKDMNESEMLLMFAYEDEEKNFSCSILIFLQTLLSCNQYYFVSATKTEKAF